MKLKDLSLENFLSYFEEDLKSVFKENSLLNEMAIYACCDGGKRVRPSLTFLYAKALNSELDYKDIIFACLSLELIHSYSLVHDDLECMDNDDFRRGKETVHKKWGEGNAVLLGDYLLTKAFEVISQSEKCSGILVNTIATYANQMVQGQVLDISGKLEKEIDFVEDYTGKTCALFSLAFRLGEIISSKEDIESLDLSMLPFNLGLAFQYQDDLLDGDENSILKVVSKHDLSHKIESLKDSIFKGLKDLENGDELKEFIISLLDRKN